MAGPTLVASYFLKSGGANTTALTTASFTPAAGEIIVVKRVVEDSGTSYSAAPSGGGLTFTQHDIDSSASHVWASIHYATVGSSPAAMTVSSGTISAVGYHSMTVERWSTAKLAATPAKSSPHTGTGAPSATITTAAANSVVSWLNGDWSAVGGARTYRSGATEEGSDQDGAGSQYVADYAWQSAATAGSQTIGLTAPTGQTWTLLGIEVQGTTTSTPGQGTASGSIAFVGSAAGKATMRGTGSGSVNFTGSAAGTTTKRGTASGSVAFTGTASGTRTPKGSGTGSVAFVGSATGSAPAVGSRNGTASGTYAYSGTATGTRTPKGSGSGSYAYAGSATGTAPVVGQKTGTAAGTVAYVGTAAGKRQPKGTASGAYALAGAASGATTRLGTAAGSYAYVGTAVGHSASVIPPADRTTLVRAESRVTRVAAESRVTTVPAERRVTEIR